MSSGVKPATGALGGVPEPPEPCEDKEPSEDPSEEEQSEVWEGEAKGVMLHIISRGKRAENPVASR